jgi:hypothetical protein
MSPTAEQMVLPSGYGTPREKLEWGSVNQMLVDAPVLGRERASRWPAAHCSARWDVDR